MREYDEARGSTQTSLRTTRWVPLRPSGPPIRSASTYSGSLEMTRCLVVALVALFTVAARGNGQTAAEARQFVQRANNELQDLQVRANRASWIQENFITEDTEALNAEVANELAVAIQRLAQGAKRFDKITVPTDVRRQLTLLKISVVTQSVTSVAPPSDPKEAAELSSLIAANDAAYGRGKYC